MLITLRRGLTTGPVSGTTYTYDEHYYDAAYTSGEYLPGGTAGSSSGNMIRQATLLHELGHARAFWRVAMPEAERRLSQYCGRVITRADAAIISSIWVSIRDSAAVKRASASAANRLEIGYMDSAVGQGSVSGRTHTWTAP